MVNPTEAIQEWINLVNIDHQDKIARFVLRRLYYMDWEPGGNDEIDVLHSVLEGSSEVNDVIGKIITIRGTIEYLMDDKGSIESWNAKIDMVMSEANDHDGSEEARKSAQRKLRLLVQEKNAWLETASSWKKLSRNVLSNKALHNWERVNILKETF